MHLVRLEIQLLERLGVEHPDQEVEGHIVAVWYDAEDGLFAFPQLLQLHVVRTGDSLDFRQGKRSQADRCSNEDAHGRLAGCLFEHFVLPQGNMVWILFLQRVKEQV